MMKSDLPAKGGRYLYCVIKGEAEDLNLSGIDNQVVSTLVYKGLTVVAHRCEPEPYFSKDSEVVTKWLAQQHKIVEEYWLRYNDVMPFTFNTIIKSDAGGAPEDLLFRWLEDNYGYIQNKLSSIEGRKEYGVQVIMDSKKAAEVLVNSDEEVVRLKVDLDRSAAGKAFLIKEKINTRLKVLIAAEADNIFRRCYSAVEQNVYRINIEKIKKLDLHKIMLLNLSCLADEEQCAELGRFLDHVNEIPYIGVNFSGPWPPYSFM